MKKRIPLLPLLAALALPAFAGSAAAAELPAPGDPAFRVPAGKVEHTVTTVRVSGTNALASHEHIERWITATRARTVVRDARTGKVLRELTYAPGEHRVFDAAKHRVTVVIRDRRRDAAPPWNTAAFEAAVQKAYVDQGITRVTGETVVGGRRALVVESVPGRWHSDEPASRTSAVVDAETFALLQRTTAMPDGRATHSESYDVAELLDASSRVRARMAMAPHKGARKVVRRG
jgi:hypothetical protein